MALPSIVYLVVPDRLRALHLFGNLSAVRAEYRLRRLLLLLLCRTGREAMVVRRTPICHLPVSKDTISTVQLIREFIVERLQMMQ